MQVGKKKLTIHRSVNTNIERKMKAFESWIVWMLKSPSVSLCFAKPWKGNAGESRRNPGRPVTGSSARDWTTGESTYQVASNLGHNLLSELPFGRPPGKYLPWVHLAQT